MKTDYSKLAIDFSDENYKIIYILWYYMMFNYGDHTI